MSKVCFLFLFPFINSIIYGQIIEENFDYNTGVLTSQTSNWVETPSIAVPIQVISGSLNYSGYPSSGVGNKIQVDGGASRSGARRQFTDVTGNGNTVYVSFLINVIDTLDIDENSGDGDYFANLLTSGSLIRSKVYIKKGTVSNTFNIGLEKTSSDLTYLATNLNINTTYLVVAAYIFQAGDDETKLWINPNLGGTEPAPDITVSSGSDADALSYIQFRQRLSSGNVYVDGIRVADSWASAPLPVELINFEGKVLDNKVKLEWLTATEVNNYGFELERFQNSPVAAGARQRRDKISKLQNWEKIGFVSGYGNSNSPKLYSFIDGSPPAGELRYRLKQIDFDGTYEYSSIIEISLTKFIEKFELEQNYPNPFNPTTTISFTIPSSVGQDDILTYDITLKVYDILGREIATLLEGNKLAGRYEIELDGSKFPSGIYYYTLSAGSYRKTMKMLLIK